MPAKVIVLGAGVIGLSTAYNLKLHLPRDTEVVVYANDFTPNLTSDGAPGIWFPIFTQGTNATSVKKWSGETFDYVTKELRTEEVSAKRGFSFCNGYAFSQQKSRQELEKWFHGVSIDTILCYKLLEDRELKEIFPPKVKSAISFTTVFIEGRKYLPDLQKRFLNLGGKIIQREINSLSEFYGECDIVVNCTGLGAKALLDDKEMFPVKGHTLKVRAPWVKQFYGNIDVEGTERGALIFPNQDCLVLGGVWRQENNCQPTVDDREFILKSTAEIIPSLKSAEVLEEWVGLRPCRTSIRLEKQLMQVADGKQLKVVHNYGHGGSGLTCHWGCALQSLQFVKEWLAIDE